MKGRIPMKLTLRLEGGGQMLTIAIKSVSGESCFSNRALVKAVFRGSTIVSLRLQNWPRLKPYY